MIGLLRNLASHEVRSCNSYKPRCHRSWSTKSREPPIFRAFRGFLQKNARRAAVARHLLYSLSLMFDPVWRRDIRFAKSTQCRTMTCRES